MQTLTFIDTNHKPTARQTTREVIAANVRAFIKQQQAGHSDALTACGREVESVARLSTIAETEEEQLDVSSRGRLIPAFFG